MLRHFERCTDVIEVTSKLNAWMERTMCVKNFSDNSEWFKRLELLQCAANELQVLLTYHSMNHSKTDQ